jgi:ornithine carbamoyltransferase
MTLRSKHLLAITDLDTQEVLGLVARAAALKKGWPAGERPRPLKDKAVALVFQKASTRTRVSFEVGIKRLGGSTIFMTDKDSQLGRSEPLKDMARVMSRYVDALVVRTFGHAVVEELAAQGSIPVVNALTDLSHPCQVLSDLLTVSERLGDLRRPVYAWLGDGNNMAHSWLEAAGVLGLELRLACPEGYRPHPEIVERARGLGARLTITGDPKEAIAGASVVSTDVWASMGQEAEAEARRKAFAGYTLDAGLLGRAAPGALVLHCLPSYRGQEISEDVLEGPQSVVWDQAENRLHMQMAIMEALLG